MAVSRDGFKLIACLLQCARMSDFEIFIPDRYRKWVLDSGSLTERVQSVCGNENFHIRVLSQYYGLPNQDEMSKLDMLQQEIVLLREVNLMCGEQAWVYARSIIPVSTLAGQQRYLAYLGEQPLGAALFADPSMRRSAIEVVRLSSKESVEDQAVVLWGRRSVFYIQDKPLLVAEYFLPDIPNAPESTH